MRHNDIQEKLEAYVDRQLSGAEEQEIKSHLIDCAGCADEVERLQFLSHSIFHPALPTKPTDFFVSRVMAGIRAHQAQTQTRRWRWSVLALSTAALFLIVTADSSAVSEGLSTRTVLMADGGALVSSYSSPAEPTDALLDISMEEI